MCPAKFPSTYYSVFASWSRTQRYIIGKQGTTITLRHVQPYHTPRRSCSCHLTRESLCIPFPILASPQPACMPVRPFKKGFGFRGIPCKMVRKCAQRYTRTRNPHNHAQPFLVGRDPPFAFWRKVGLQDYTKICSAATGIAVQSDCSVHNRPISG